MPANVDAPERLPQPTVAEMDHGRAKLEFLVTAREKKQWNV